MVPRVFPAMRSALRAPVKGFAVDNRLPTGDRQIAEVTLVAAVEGFRPEAIVRAVRARRLAADGEVDDLAAQLYLLDNEPGARRQQHLRIHRPPLGWPGDPPGRRGLPEYSGVVQFAPANLDNVFEDATRAAGALGMSRSEFFAKVARRYLKQIEAESLTREIDA